VIGSSPSGRTCVAGNQGPESRLTENRVSEIGVLRRSPFGRNTSTGTCKRLLYTCRVDVESSWTVSAAAEIDLSCAANGAPLRQVAKATTQSHLVAPTTTIFARSIRSELLSEAIEASARCRGYSIHAATLLREHIPYKKTCNFRESSTRQRVDRFERLPSPMWSRSLDLTLFPSENSRDRINQKTTDVVL